LRLLIDRLLIFCITPVSFISLVSHGSTQLLLADADACHPRQTSAGRAA
jgi:hypothetical protein